MKFFLVAVIALLLLPLTTAAAAEEAAVEKLAGPLADYVAKPDDSFRWAVRREQKLGEAPLVEVTLTSQTWRGITWKHQLFLLKPKSVKADASHALLFIAGGTWKDSLDKPPGARDGLPKEAFAFATLAEQTGLPVAVLLQVPHQPILGGRVEDDAIAHTFENFMRTGDPEWLLLLPMVKSAVRGMDATSQYAKKHWSLDIKTFTVSGASKRGWTTWLTGAVDARATGIAPMVIDMLNTAAQMKHQVDTWGGYSEQIHDYTDRGLQKHLASEAGKKLNAIVDPYAYRDRLKQPKLILLGTNDRYWPLDALNLYWDGLPGEKYICYVPNNGHGLKDLDRIAGGLAALHRRVAENKPLPQMTWGLKEKDGKLHLRLTSDVKPRTVQAWIAHSKTRDFRPAKWSSEAMTADGDKFTHQLTIPAEGFAAMFGEAVFNGEKLPLYLSTNVRIVGGKVPAAAAGK
ncbi:MAG: PhoPQ-activated protein PqaA family protein [Pirellulales bacterium]